MSNVTMLQRTWIGVDGLRILPGLVDRDFYPEIPESYFWATFGPTAASIESRIAAAVAEEREAIAKMVDKRNPTGVWANFAAAIRARGGK